MNALASANTERLVSASLIPAAAPGGIPWADRLRGPLAFRDPGGRSLFRPGSLVARLAPHEAAHHPPALSRAEAPVTDDPGDLVRRAQGGDRQAFGELFRLHRGEVARLVQRMLGSRGADVEDVLQEVFLQVHRSLGDFRGQAKFSTWLHRVAVNVVLMTRRAAKSRPVLTGELPVEREQDPRPLPDEEAGRRARIAAFWSLVERLSEKKRVVFILHDLEGVPPAEIAEIVDAPVLTVRTRLFYARRELEAMLREEPKLAGVVDREPAERPAPPVPEPGEGVDRPGRRPRAPRRVER